MQRRIAVDLPFSIRFFLEGKTVIKTQLLDTPGYVEIHSNSTECVVFINDWIHSFASGKIGSMNYALHVSPFVDKVLREIEKIPFGQVITYKDLAEKIGSEKAVRAAASACGKNPLPLLIGCHRVVATSSLGGFAFGVRLKKKILDFERQILLSK